MATKSKAKGNAFEIKLSKELSQWMFNDPNILWRDSTSGGRKVIYNGDIIPAQVDKFPWSTWPFIIEAKHGYKEFIPTLMNQNKVRYWLTKLMDELTPSQYIPILIAKFHNQSSILITTIPLNVYCDISMNVIHESKNTSYIYYVYDYNRVMSTPFSTAMPVELCEYLNNKG